MSCFPVSFPLAVHTFRSLRLPLLPRSRREYLFKRDFPLTDADTHGHGLFLRVHLHHASGGPEPLHGDHRPGFEPGAEFVELNGVKDFLRADSARIDLAITVGQLLDELAETRPDWCSLVELKYFLGLTDEEAADVLGLKLRSMQRMWRDARQWLFERSDEGRGKHTTAG